MKQQPHRACEQTESKQKQNQVTSHSVKQYSGTIKGWLPCLTSELKRRFFVNNIFMFGSGRKSNFL